jgi:hypothetical protein
MMNSDAVPAYAVVVRHLLCRDASACLGGSAELACVRFVGAGSMALTLMLWLEEMVMMINIMMMVICFV